MASAATFRPWADLQHDLLVSIMSRLGAADLLSGGAPRTCTSWLAAARDPLAWRHVDLSDWTALSSARWEEGTGAAGGRTPPRAALTGLLAVATTRAAGQTESLLLPDFADEDHLLFLADRTPNLHYFSLPTTSMSHDRFCEAISKLQSLKGMAVDENLIDCDVLLHVHQCCPDFQELEVFAFYVDENMASIICSSLPHLKKLEISNSSLSNAALIKFLDYLEELEYLDISGYETSMVSSSVLNKASRLKVFLWSSKFELGEFVDCSNCGEHCIDNQEPCKCMMEHKVMDWLAGPLETD